MTQEALGLWRYDSSLKTATEMIDGSRMDARIFLQDTEPQLVDDVKWILETYRRLDPIDPLDDYNVEGAILYILEVSGDEVFERANEINERYQIYTDDPEPTGLKALNLANDLFFER